MYKKQAFSFIVNQGSLLYVGGYHHV